MQVKFFSHQLWLCDWNSLLPSIDDLQLTGFYTNTRNDSKRTITTDKKYDSGSGVSRALIHQYTYGLEVDQILKDICEICVINFIAMSPDKIVLQCLDFKQHFTGNQERAWISSHCALQNVFRLLNCYQFPMCNLKNCLQVPVQSLQANGKVKLIKKIIN